MHHTSQNQINYSTYSNLSVTQIIAKHRNRCNISCNISCFTVAANDHTNQNIVALGQGWSPFLALLVLLHLRFAASATGSAQLRCRLTVRKANVNTQIVGLSLINRNKKITTGVCLSSFFWLSLLDLNQRYNLNSTKQLVSKYQSSTTIRIKT